MFKSLQIKIILIIMLVGIVMLAGFEYLIITEMKTLDITENIIAKNQQIAAISLIAYLVISFIIILFATKTVSKPINKLIESAKQIASGQDIVIEDRKEEKSKTDIDELTDAFNGMIKGLSENLNEMTRQKKQIETILFHMTDGIIAFDMNGDIIHINPAAIRLLNISEKDKTFNDIFGKINSEINMEKIIYLEEWATTVEKIEINGRHINLFFAPFKDENDRPSGIMVLAQDITEHVKLDNMRKEFIADVSHELKTPLTSIMGYAETLASSEYDKELQDKFLNVIINESARMAKLVSDLLTLSKHDNAQTKWEKTEIDLGELVKKCQEKLQIEIDKKQQKVECLVTANVPPIYADKDGIERVVLNILSNSIKYTQDGGTIRIYVGFLYNDAYIKVIDNGIGIPEKDLDRIFERFYRVDKARSRELGGTGLRIVNSKRNIR